MLPIVWRSGLSVNCSPIAYANNQDADKLVFDACDDAVVANTVLPEVAEFRALERLANAALVVKWGNAIVEEAVYSAPYLWVKPIQFVLRSWVKVNRPGHIPSSLPQEESS